jgi:hypothetical protein
MGLSWSIHLPRTVKVLSDEEKDLLNQQEHML